MWSLPVDGKRQSFMFGPRLRSDSGQLLLEGARAELGAAALPTFCTVEPLLNGELMPLLQPYSPSGGQISGLPEDSAHAAEDPRAHRIAHRRDGHPAR
jgi:DNA-binding transcriptional LysR family regulator